MQWPRSRRARQQALEVLEDVLRRTPQRQDVRRKLVTLALDLGRSSDAEFHLKVLRTASPNNGELESLSGRCQEAAGQYAEAAEWYEKAIKHAPGEIESYTRLADLYRRRLNEPERTDALMNAMATEMPTAADTKLW